MSPWDGFYLCLGKIVVFTVIAVLFLMIAGGRAEEDDE